MSDDMDARTEADRRSPRASGIDEAPVPQPRSETDGVSRRGIVKTFAAGAVAGSLAALGRSGAPMVAAQEATPEGQTGEPQGGPASPWWKANSPFLKGVMTSPNLEPAIPHPERDEQAAAKLSALATKAGRKPNLVIDLRTPPDVRVVARWAQAHHIRTLNVAGPRESTVPGIYDDASGFVVKLFEILRR